MERRIAEIPASEWDDLSIDLTPREYVLDFLAHAFPVQLQEPFTDDDGNVMSPARVRRRRQPGALPGSGGKARRAHSETRLLAAGAVCARPDRPPLRTRCRRRGHRTLAPGAQDYGRQGRAPGAALPSRLGQPRRDRRLHGWQQAHPGLLDGRRHRAQLPRRSRLRQHRAPRPLSAGTGLAGRPGNPGPWPDPPHAPGLGAPVPPGHHGREGRAPLHRHHRQKARFPRRHHPGPARLPDRHGRR